MPDSRAQDAARNCSEVLLALKLGGRLTLSDISIRTGLDGPEAREALRIGERDALVASHVAPDGGLRYRLSPKGVPDVVTFLEDERRTIGHALAELVDTFDRDNARLKELVQRWQMRPDGALQVPNDHSDAAYDERLLRELGSLFARAESWLRKLPTTRPRYVRYRARLAAALDRAGRGEVEYVCGLSVDSVHSIWWQLHADLLAVLGRVRSEADA